VAKNPQVPKLVTLKHAEEVAETLEYFQPILAFEGSAKVEIKGVKTPKIDVLKEPQKLIEIVEKRIGPIIKKRRALEETLTIQVNETTLPLNPFAQKFIRNIIISIASTLKEATIKGDENVSIKIEQQQKTSK